MWQFYEQSILCGIMSCEVAAALPFQANANYGTWSIDVGKKDFFLKTKNVFLTYGQLI